MPLPAGPCGPLGPLGPLGPTSENTSPRPVARRLRSIQAVRIARDWLLGSAAQAALLFCHFPAALLFLPLLVARIALTAWMSRSRRVAGAQSAAFVAALGLSAWSWLPAKADVAMERLVQGPLRYSNHFVDPLQLFSWKWGYGRLVRDDAGRGTGAGHRFSAALARARARRRAGVPQSSRTCRTGRRHESPTFDLALWTPERLASSGFESTTLGEVTPRWRETIPPYHQRSP